MEVKDLQSAAEIKAAALEQGYNLSAFSCKLADTPFHGQTNVILAMEFSRTYTQCPADNQGIYLDADSLL